MEISNTIVQPLQVSPLGHQPHDVQPVCFMMKPAKNGGFYQSASTLQCINGSYSLIKQGYASAYAGSEPVQLKAAPLHLKDREGPCMQAEDYTVCPPQGTHASKSRCSTSIHLEQANLDATYVQSILGTVECPI